MVTAVKMTCTGFDGVRKVLNNLASAIENPDEKLMQRLGAVCLDDIDMRFATRGYGSWAPLKPSTIKRKGHDFVLVDTGAMQTSARIKSLTKGMVSVGVFQGGKNHDPDVPGYHQSVTRRMPQRKIIEVTPRLKEALTKESALFYSDMINGFSPEVKK